MRSIVSNRVIEDWNSLVIIERETTKVIYLNITNILKPSRGDGSS